MIIHFISQIGLANEKTIFRDQNQPFLPQCFHLHRRPRREPQAPFLWSLVGLNNSRGNASILKNSAPHAIKPSEEARRISEAATI